MWHDRAANEAETHMTRHDAEGLKKLVDRLRRERNSARSDAMRWLEQQRSCASPFAGGGDGDENGVFPKTPGRSGGLGSRARSAPDGLVNDMDGGGPSKVMVDAKAAAAIAKLKSKVDRLRRERDDAEKQAAAWLKAEQEKLAGGGGGGGVQGGDRAAPVATVNGGENGWADHGDGGVSPGLGGGPVVASLRAEGLQLKRELQEAREEAERLKRMAPPGAMDSAGNSGDQTQLMNGLAKVRVDGPLAGAGCLK